MKRVTEIKDRWSQDQLATGMGFLSWMRVLHRNQYQVGLDYFHRLAWVTGLSIPMSALALAEKALYGRKIGETELKTPLIILGHWRSGTTHLHNLLGRDPQHCFSTVYQAVFSTHFVLSGRVGPNLLRNALPATRSYDQVKHGWFEAAEDEIGLVKLNDGLSFYLALMFPDLAEEYERLIDLREASNEERQRWKDAFILYLKKLTFDSPGTRVVVKSCPHSARIPLLLEMFPDAKFVHIHRHPARVFVSMVHMRGKIDWENFLCRPTEEFIGSRREHTLRIGERVFGRLLEDRHSIPKENLIEIAYDDLCGNEMEMIKGLYQQLELGGWEGYQPILADYLDGVAGYKINRLSIDEETLDLVYERWRSVYDAFRYPREEGPPREG
jgi:omega-hydroxy-beta-dihydromenaquinone-9 sulfotransferase